MQNNSAQLELSSSDEEHDDAGVNKQVEQSFTCVSNIICLCYLSHFFSGKLELQKLISNINTNIALSVHRACEY